MRKWRCLVALWVGFGLAGFSYAAGPHSSFSLGLEVGTWKPTALSSERPLEPAVLPGTRALVGLGLGAALREDLDLVVSAEYWEQYRLPQACAAARVRIVPAGVCFRHRFAEDSWFSPFADYGLLVMFGYEKVRSVHRWRKGNGYGASLGAGMAISLGRSLTIVLRGGYVYARFGRPLGQTDDYSGTTFSLWTLIGL
ncbi:MAG: hypothetical protein ONB23_02340 [candidate division KSB1 bacterium]|nr:hypothetical protein [candidate division KSB1 bacterium]